MAEEINFLDLAALSKISPDTVVEKYGGLINSSFFDASNILGTLKLKGLIDFSTIFAGQNAIKVTGAGKQLLDEASAKAAGTFDELDFAIISQLSASKRTLQELTGLVNLRPTDLALHIYKLVQQQYVSYTIRNGNLDITLTEKGFLQAKAGMPKPEASQEQQAAQSAAPTAVTPAIVQSQEMQQNQPAAANGTQGISGGTLQDLTMAAPSKGNTKTIAIVVAIVLVIIALLVLRQEGLLSTVGL
jgi:hypothetical protein